MSTSRAVRDGLVGDGVEVAAAWSRRVVATERRLVVRVTAGTHVAAGSRVLRVGWLAAGACRCPSQHVRLVTGSELLADSLAVLQHGQSCRSRLQYSVTEMTELVSFPHALRCAVRCVTRHAPE